MSVPVSACIRSDKLRAKEFLWRKSLIFPRNSASASFASGQSKLLVCEFSSVTLRIKPESPYVVFYKLSRGTVVIRLAGIMQQQGRRRTNDRSLRLRRKLRQNSLK